MSNNKNPFETLDERHVTKTWIKENFNLDQHRIEIDATDTIMSRPIERESPSVLDRKDVQALQDVFDKGGSVVILKRKSGIIIDEIVFQSCMPRLENDKEVTDRLQEEQQKAIRRERQKAKKRKEKEQNDKAIAEMEERASSVQFEI